MPPDQPRTTSHWCHLVLQGCLLLCLGFATLQVRAAQILLTASESNDAMLAFTQALAKLRPSDQVSFSRISDLPAPRQLPAGARLILLDPASLDWRLQDHLGPPTLVMSISRVQAHERLGELRPSHLSLLWSDPPPARQLRLIRAMLPEVRRVGVLYSHNSEFLLLETRRAARSLGLEIVTRRWNDTFDSQPLQTLLNDSEVLLGLDDPTLYNPSTAKRLLLSCYTRRQALIGPTASFVWAGSLASTYSSEQDWLYTLDDLLDRPPTRWPRAQYAKRFNVLSNPQVARSLGIEDIDESALANRLTSGEVHP